jgi:MFS family permease
MASLTQGLVNAAVAAPAEPTETPRPRQRSALTRLDAELVARSRTERRVRVTMACLCLCSFLDYSDKFALAGLFLPFQKRFGVGPEALASLVMAQNLALAVSSPLWGWLADGGSSIARHRLLASACLAWAVLTALSACATRIWQLAILRALTGVALAGLLPIQQSMVADMITEPRRGIAYGLVGMVAWCGAIAGSVLSTAIGDRPSTPLPQVAGWQAVLLLLGGASLLVAGLLGVCAHDPPRVQVAAASSTAAAAYDAAAYHPILASSPRIGRGCSPLPSSVRQLRNEVFGVSTFLLLTLQGLVLSMGDQGVASFLTLWLQYVGFGDDSAGLLGATNFVGCACGALLAGVLGDLASRRLPASGRVLTCQAGLLACISAWLGVFFCLGRRADAPGIAALCFLGGAAGAMITPPTKAILAEVVTPSFRAAAFAWMYACACGSGALLGAPLTAFFASRLGYVAYTQPVKDLTPAQRHANASALSHAMLALCVPAWSLGILIWAGVTRTYLPDRDRARANVRQRAGQEASSIAGSLHVGRGGASGSAAAGVHVGALVLGDSAVRLVDDDGAAAAVAKPTRQGGVDM